MRFNHILLAIGLVAGSVGARADGAAPWGYYGQTGPVHWADLDPAYAECGAGRNQSPVDLGTALNAELPPLEFLYHASEAEIVNNGHSIQVNLADAGSVIIGDHAYHLRQFHFHAPSEHRIDGRGYPMEMHLVHADDQGQLAMIAVLMEVGRPQAHIRRLWDSLPTIVGEARPLEDEFNASWLLPPAHAYYRYNGSLTTPPCSEGVAWVVMTHPLSVDEEVPPTLRAILGGPNNRPLQPLNARTVLR